MTQTRPLTDQLITVADAFSEASGIGRKRVSFLVLGGGSRLDNIANGGDLNTRSFERAMQWFSDNWPDGADWPCDIDRPPPAVACGAGAGPAADPGAGPAGNAPENLEAAE